MPPFGDVASDSFGIEARGGEAIGSTTVFDEAIGNADSRHMLATQSGIIDRFQHR